MCNAVNELACCISDMFMLLMHHETALNSYIICRAVMYIKIVPRSIKILRLVQALLL